MARAKLLVAVFGAVCLSVAAGQSRDAGTLSSTAGPESRLLAPLAVVNTAQAATALGIAPWCGTPYVEDYYDYGWDNQDYSDGGGDCLYGVDGGQESEAERAIDEICEGYLCPECSDIKNALLTSTSWHESTGWYDQGYWNDARWWPNGDIGMHWDYMGSSWLWAHEGAHEAFYAEEEEANYWATACTSI